MATVAVQPQFVSSQEGVELLQKFAREAMKIETFYDKAHEETFRWFRFTREMVEKSRDGISIFTSMGGIKAWIASRNKRTTSSHRPARGERLISRKNHNPSSTVSVHSRFRDRPPVASRSAAWFNDMNTVTLVRRLR